MNACSQPGTVVYPLAVQDTRLMAVLLAGFLCFLNLYAPQPLLPLLSSVFAVSHGAVCLVVTAETLAIALAAPFAGSLVQALGRQRMLKPAVYGIVLTAVLSATASSLPWMVLWRFLQGLFLPLVFAIMFSTIGEEWKDHGVGKIMSWYVTSTVVGGFCGRFLCGVVGEHLGWRSALLLVAVFDLACGLALLQWLPESRRAVVPFRLGTSITLLKQQLGSPAILAACAIGFNVLFSLLATFTYVTFYLAGAPFHLGPAALGSVFVVYLVGVVVTPLAGSLIERAGYRSVLMTAMGCAAAGALLTLVPTLPAVLLGLALCASGVFVAQSTASGFVTETAGPAGATAAGLYLAFYYFGGSAGSAVPGWLWSAGGWTACVALVVAIQLVTIALAARFLDQGRTGSFTPPTTRAASLRPTTAGALGGTQDATSLR